MLSWDSLTLFEQNHGSPKHFELGITQLTHPELDHSLLAHSKLDHACLTLFELDLTQLTHLELDFSLLGPSELDHDCLKLSELKHTRLFLFPSINSSLLCTFSSNQVSVKARKQVFCIHAYSLQWPAIQQILLKIHFVIKDPNHALYGEFKRLPHGRRFRSLVCKTNRRGNSFVPTAIRLLLQPFLPAELICILYLGCCLNVWWVSD